MEIRSVKEFIKYLERTHTITSRVIDVIPPGKIDWQYMPGKFTLGDMVRHIAAIERFVFMEVIRGNKPAYKGCGRELADGYENTISYYREMHQQSLHILSHLTDSDLEKKIKTLDGRETTAANFLRALIVHEVHHRGALCIYLNLLGVATPPVIGLSEQQVIELSNN